MNRISKYFMLYFILIFCINHTTAYAVLKININRGNSEKIPLSLKVCENSNYDLWNEIKEVVTLDLNNSGIINVLDEKVYGPICSSNTSIINNNFNQSSATQLLMHTEYKNERIIVKFRLFDPLTNRSLIAKMFMTDVREHRKLAHMISDAIYSKFTGDNGYFNTKIVYIAEERKRKRVAIMDQDGANNQFVTSGDNLTLNPRFSPDNKKITYTSYVDNQAKVFYHNLVNGVNRIVGKFSGVVAAPRFSPDGKYIVLARSADGSTDIYKIELSSGRATRLTAKSSINTSPSYSPDQKKIVFNSDRTGTSHLYTMNADGTNQKRISRGVGLYMSPVWSPRGDLIAFTKVYNKHFYIGLMSPDGSDERILSSGYLVEGTNWSPNGKVIIFTKVIKSNNGKKNKSEIHTIDIMGFNERLIKTTHNASEPHWSGLLS